jgi:hypothetical protein
MQLKENVIRESTPQAVDVNMPFGLYIGLYTFLHGSIYSCDRKVQDFLFWQKYFAALRQ